MKLDPDCVRDILLFLEDSQKFHHLPKELEAALPNYQKNQILYTLERLHEGGFIKVHFTDLGINEFISLIDTLTFDGHQYLETIRDSGIWKKTKDAAAKVGSFSLTLLSSIAMNLLQATVNRILPPSSP